MYCFEVNWNVNDVVQMYSYSAFLFELVRTMSANCCMNSMFGA